MKQIEIGGKLRPVKFGINALADFNDGTNTTLEWIFRIIAKPLSMKFNEMRWLIFVGLKHGAKAENEVIDFDVEDIGNWLDKDFNKLNEYLDALWADLPHTNDSKKKYMRRSRRK